MVRFNQCITVGRFERVKPELPPRLAQVPPGLDKDARHPLPEYPGVVNKTTPYLISGFI
jgi:hypothetical protein